MSIPFENVHMPRCLGLIFLVLACVGVTSCQTEPGYYEPVQKVSESQKRPSIQAPDFEVIDFKGNTISLKELKGKVVFLDFWATWCPPCVISAPEIENMSEFYKGQDVEVISISLDSSEDVVRSFVRRNNLKGRMAMAGTSQVDLKYRVRSLPTFFLIDKKGELVSAWNGFHPRMVQTWRNEIDRLLKL